MTIVERERTSAGGIGERRPRIDADVKIRGEAKYAGDLDVPGLLHGRLVLSPYAHARIVRVESGDALATPGVVAVLRGEDLPTRARNGARRYEPLACGEAVFAGQPVALVVATSEAAAADGAELVLVEYEELPAVVSLGDAVAEGAPPARLARDADADATSSDASLHAAVGGRGAAGADDYADSANVTRRTRYRSGDVNAAFAACDAVVEAEYETSWLHQAQLEPQVATAWLDAGELVVSTSTQGVFFTQQELARIYGLPAHRVRVRGETLGGGFGAKYLLIEPIVAGAALALQRPVRLTLTRTEDFLAGQPAQGMQMTVRVGATQDGTFVALEARLLLDTGAYGEWSVDAIAPVFLAGAYRWPAHDISSYGVQTNKVGVGAYRGPGAPPLTFALESLLDELAAHLALDPIELRRRNLAQPGDAMIDGAPWPPIGAGAVLDAIADHPLWQTRSPGDGIGLALGVWPGAKEPASAICRLDDDGGCTIVTGAIDMTGTATGFTAIAAEAFGIAAEHVRIVFADSASAPRTPASGGSVITYAVGRAIQDAASNARARLLQVAAQLLEVDPEELAIADGVVQRRTSNGSEELAIADLAARIAGGSLAVAPIEAVGSAAPGELAPSCAAHLIRVTVDPDTYQVSVAQHVVAQDVGHALNPALVEGQIRGGAAQAIGWALLEELVHDENGTLMTPNFASYTVPSAEHIPRIEPLIIEVPSKYGPFGAKGIGEASVIAGPAAIANAIADATGARLRRLPMTPWRIWCQLTARPRRAQ